MLPSCSALYCRRRNNCRYVLGLNILCTEPIDCSIVSSPHALDYVRGLPYTYLRHDKAIFGKRKMRCLHNLHLRVESSIVLFKVQKQLPWPSRSNYTSRKTRTDRKKYTRANQQRRAAPFPCTAEAMSAGTTWLPVLLDGECGSYTRAYHSKKFIRN